MDTIAPDYLRLMCRMTLNDADVVAHCFVSVKHIFHLIA